MGLFTNRKHEGADTDTVNSASAIAALTPFFDTVETSDDDGWQPAGAAETAGNFFDNRTTLDRRTTEVASAIDEAGSGNSPVRDRTLEDQPTAEASSDNDDIDVGGLLHMLGVSAEASLSDISEARLRFLSEHDPSDETDADAAQIKERIRREVNTAYASFRLTRGG